MPARPRRAARRRAQRPVGAGEHRCEHRVQDMQRIDDAAAVHTRMHVALPGGDGDVHARHPAKADGDRWRRLVRHAGIEHDRAVGAAAVVTQPAGDAGAPDLLLALDEHPHVDRQRAGMDRQRAGTVQLAGRV